MSTGFCIVYNGAETLEACIENALLALDRMVIVEGAVEGFAVDSQDGHSNDGTMDILRSLKARHNDRVILVQRDRFWNSKTEMCNAALLYVPKGILWQIDCDEFYFPAKMREVNEYLEAKPHINAVEFWGRHFYGSHQYHVDMLEGLDGNNPPWRRVFRYEGEPWLSHEPPRLGTTSGITQVMLRGLTIEEFRIELFHYGYVWRSQVIKRTIHYRQPHVITEYDAFREHGTHPPGKPLVKYTGPHPVSLPW